MNSDVMVDFTQRHDRPGDNPRFVNTPEHGFFINPDTSNLTYTIMATGDDELLDDGPDNGRGRLYYFSAPPELQTPYNVTIGSKNDDNTFKITKSRNIYFNDQMD